MAAVLSNELQTLEHICCDWSDPDWNHYLQQCKKVLDWLTENDIAVNERSGSHRALFDQYLTPDPYSAIAGGSKP